MKNKINKLSVSYVLFALGSLLGTAATAEDSKLGVVQSREVAVADWAKTVLPKIFSAQVPGGVLAGDFKIENPGIAWAAMAGINSMPGFSNDVAVFVVDFKGTTPEGKIIYGKVNVAAHAPKSKTAKIVGAAIVGPGIGVIEKAAQAFGNKVPAELRKEYQFQESKESESVPLKVLPALRAVEKAEAKDIKLNLTSDPQAANAPLMEVREWLPTPKSAKEAENERKSNATQTAAFFPQ